MRPKNRKSIQERLFLDWETVPVGTDVIVTRDSGDEFKTKVRQPAMLLEGHSAVIWVDGIRGCYALNRVRKA